MVLFLGELWLIYEIAKLVNITLIATMVYDTCNYSIHGIE